MNKNLTRFDEPALAVSTYTFCATDSFKHTWFNRIFPLICSMCPVKVIIRHYNQLEKKKSLVVFQ